MAASAVAGTAASIDGARRQKNQAQDAQEAAAAQAKQAAEQAAKQAEQAAKQAEDETKAADQAFNRTNQKKPAQKPAAANALPGGGSTMLTGPKGVDPNALTLGKSTLLGQ